MVEQYGARQEAWHHFASLLGLRADLLPVVSNPNATISPDSKVKALGKTPSRYNFRGDASGLPKWTEMVATEQDIGRWETEPDYGICIQTRTIRAIDIDVPDPRKAAAILRTIKTALPSTFFPERHRLDTGKTLLAFRYPFPMPKRVIPVDGGMIEFLGDGQQFVADGTYIDSKTGLAHGRYEWRGGLPIEFPLLNETDLQLLWDSLVVMHCVGDPVIAREKREPPADGTKGWTGGQDDVADWLVERGYVLDQDRDGRLFISCPFEQAHTGDSGATATCYFPSGSGGYEQGHFKCLHAHCAGRADRDFREAIGYEAALFPLIEDADPIEPGAGRADLLAGDDADQGDAPADMGLDARRIVSKIPQLPVDWPRFLRDDKGRIEPTFENMVKAVERADIVDRWIAFDAFSFGIMWARYVKDELPQWQPWQDHDYVDLRIEMEKRGFKGFDQGSLRAVVNRVAKCNSIDTAQEWLSRIEWDGKQRVNRFLVDVMGCADTPYADAVSRYLWSALAGRILSPGVKADMAPIFKSPQGTGKTSAIEMLVPSEDFYCEVNLSKRDEDTSRRLRGKLVAELEELRGLSSRAIEEVKAFISRRKESWIPKYMEMEATFMRRCLFFGSTNQDEFLGDDSGERRWLPIETGKINLKKMAKQREQLWAEGAMMFLLDGVDYKDAETLAPAEHIKFKKSDPWHGAVARWLAEPDPFTHLAPYQRPYDWGVEDVLVGAIGLRTEGISASQSIRIGAILAKFNAIKKRDRKRGWLYTVEPDLLEPWIINQLLE